eukprot:scaffold181434_cov36-Prasinocladus_malaysianus.AAC.1
MEMRGKKQEHTHARTHTHTHTHTHTYTNALLLDCTLLGLHHGHSFLLTNLMVSLELSQTYGHGVTVNSLVSQPARQADRYTQRDGRMQEKMDGWIDGGI